MSGGLTVHKVKEYLDGLGTKGLLIAAGTVAAVLLVVGLLVFWPRPVAPPAPPVAPVVGVAKIATGSAIPSASVGASSSATTLTSSATTDTTVPGNGIAGSGQSSGFKPHTNKPKQSQIDSLAKGQWLLYDAQLLASGVVHKNGKQTDINAIQIELGAVTKSGSGTAHAIFQVSFSATSQQDGSAPWQIFGTWVMFPTAGENGKRVFAEGVQGALGGSSTTKPPSRSGVMSVGVNPIGAYRQGKQAIQGGSFKGNPAFEGVLSLPSIPPPPPS